MQVHPFLSEHDLQELFADYEGLYNTIIAGDEKKADRLSQAHLARRRAQVERLPAAAFAFNRSNG
jgi:DNA-binding FadR family transcriptional regulator